MKTITLRLDDEVHKDIKIKVINEGKTLQDYILELIIKDLEKSKK